MATTETIKQRIIVSVFEKRSAAGGPPESYVSHVKIWDDGEDGQRKPRYILLSINTAGEGFIHKSKMNTNSSFSVGKTWKLNELRGVEIAGPNTVVITLARAYRWQTDDTREQSEFVAAIIRTFRSITAGRVSLTLVNVEERPRVLVPPKNIDDRVRAAPGPRVPAIGRSSPAPVPRNMSPISPVPSGPLSQPTGRLGFRRPESLSSMHSSASTSVPSVYPRSPPAVNELPPMPWPGSERSARPSLEEARSSGYSDRQSGPSTPRARQTPSPAPPSIDFARAPSPAPSPLQLPPVAPLQPRAQRLEPNDMSRSFSRAESPRTLPRGESEPQRPMRRDPSNAPLAASARKDSNARISFFDPANQAAIDRLLVTERSSQTSLLDEDSAEATMANVEEMLEGYEWANEAAVLSGAKRKRGTADQIEARLQDELMALEKASIYAFLEEDDRIGLVLKYVDDALHELDSMDTFVSSYKIHLNAVNDDISYIQSQNRGLQVQTQNQKALLSELEQLLQTVHVDRESLLTLTQESLEKQSGIERLEGAAGELYKALLAGRDTDMAATMERLEEYLTHNGQFCKRLHDFLQIMFNVQSDRALHDKGRVNHEIRRHTDLESYIGRYAGLMLYLKEMSEDWYSKVCATYFSTISALHNQEMKDLMVFYGGIIKKATEEELEMSFNPTQTATNRGGEQLRRAKSLAKSPLDRKDREKRSDKEMRGSEALGLVLEQIGPQIYHEEQFIADFLQITNVTLTFADYLNLESYFRRQASRSSHLSQVTLKLVRGAMDLIFGFLAGELKTWIDIAIAKDSFQVIGTLIVLERTMKESEEKGNLFWSRLLQKQHQRIKGAYDRHVDEQIRAIEQTKLTSKKRKGVAHFIKYFPVYVGRVEPQLVGFDVLDVRSSVDAAYEKIVQTMFESLKHMAKMEGEGEDKGQLNYHVELVENMRYFISEISQQEVGNIKVFMRPAQSIYDENLNAYVKLVLRRPLARIIDYFDGVDRLLQTTAPSEVSNNSNYNKSALKRTLKECNAKDMRRHIDALYKRVEKHFADEDTGSTALLKDVWTACEQDLVRCTDRFSRLILQCYKDTGVILEFSVQDVEAAFRKHRMGGSS
ncbi:exocyst complex component sec3 subunit [Hysterangium stoloniferum]|nr:exocyst complex component sec3 subunit [Hysterangium stoloniferum]